jgi:flagellar hook assembly protein FlgD
LKFDFLSPASDIVIYNIQGLKVAEFTDVSGKFEWNGKNMDGQQVAPGIYLYIVKTTNREYSGKIYIVK